MYCLAGGGRHFKAWRDADLLPCTLLCGTLMPRAGLKHPGPLPQMPAGFPIFVTIRITALHLQNAPLGDVTIQERIPGLRGKGKLLICGFIESPLCTRFSVNPDSSPEDHPRFTHKEMKVQRGKVAWPRSPSW